MKKIIAILVCVCVALAIELIEEHKKRVDAQELTVRQERQLKELYSQVNELTIQYIGIVKRVQGHGGKTNE